MIAAERPVFELAITPTADDIDELGHVNNAVYIRWLQDIATAHWQTVGRPQDVEKYLWVAVRHEIDYLRAILPGETILARSWVADAPRGARFDRYVEFIDQTEKVHARAKTTWAIIDRISGRPLRIPPGLAEPFLHG